MHSDTAVSIAGEGMESTLLIMAVSYHYFYSNSKSIWNKQFNWLITEEIQLEQMRPRPQEISKQKVFNYFMTVIPVI